MGNLLPPIDSYCYELQKETSLIPTTRQQLLQRLSDYIISRLRQQKQAQITIICTHNSRRSHLAQLWLAVIADFLQIADIQTFSGGTEATALNPRVVTALKKVGFEVTTQTPVASNPHYEITWSVEQIPAIAFFIFFAAAPNPTNEFAAIMVCNEADAGCPIVEGADFRLAVPFNDPKAFDDTEVEAEKYLERCRDIGREMMFVMQQVQQKGSF